MPNIAIVWDFDGTLTVGDTTTTVVEFLQGKKSGGEFWDRIHNLRGDSRQVSWEHVLASDAPIWMYALSRLAFEKRVPLNFEFFSKFIVPSIQLRGEALKFLRKIKLLESRQLFKDVSLNIEHFVVSAGLVDLVKAVIPNDILKHAFGCRYEIVAFEGNEDEPESVPVFCMDETMKTRSLFEIAKGSFLYKDRSVNRKVPNDKYWAPFKNIIYVGDGPTDVPALSLVRNYGGTGIAVYDSAAPRDKREARLKEMRLDKRADLITRADYSEKGELFRYLTTCCERIALRYRAEQSI
jgi:2-hydroxy-3-keto-5-methylthiopentenyl-1-phosphate phosphatase